MLNYIPNPLVLQLVFILKRCGIFYPELEMGVSSGKVIPIISNQTCFDLRVVENTHRQGVAVNEEKICKWIAKS